MKFKQELFLVQVVDEYRVTSYEVATDYATTIARKVVEVEFDLPSKVEIRDIKLKILKKELQEVRAKAELHAEDIEAKIQKLMALEAV